MKTGLGLIISVGVLASLQSSLFTRLPIVPLLSTAGIVIISGLRSRYSVTSRLQGKDQVVIELLLT